jgi:hypothetical protein
MFCHEIQAKLTTAPKAKWRRASQITPSYPCLTQEKPNTDQNEWTAADGEVCFVVHSVLQMCSIQFLSISYTCFKITRSYFQTVLMSGVHKLTKNLEAISKFYAAERWHKALPGCSSPPPQNPPKPKFIKHRFFRYYDIKSFTWFTFQPKSTTEIGWLLVH